MLGKPRLSGHLAGMSATELSAILILLAVCAGMSLILLLLAMRSGRRLRRIERLLEARDAAAKSPPSPAAAATPAPRGEFETFLTEDPARQQLPKSEQFKAYRRWRREKGLNWSQP